MNALIRTSPVPTGFTLPPLPDYVERAIDLHCAGQRLADNARPLPLEAMRQVVAAYDAYSRPATPEQVRDWLIAVCGQQPWQPTPAELALLVAGTCEACAPLPGWAFNASTRAEAIRQFCSKRPSGGDVYALLAEQTAGLRRRVGALRALSHPGGFASAQATKKTGLACGSDRPAQTQAEVQAMVTVWRARIAEILDAAPPPTTRARVREKTISDAHRLAEYERMAAKGSDLAAAILPGLRAKIAGDAA